MKLLNNPTLSVVTVCDKPISKEFYLLELLKSVSKIADEIVIISSSDRGDNHEMDSILSKYLSISEKKDDINIFYIPWQKRGKKNTYWMWKSIGIYQASCDYVLRLDADEVLLDTEENINKIRQAMLLDYNCYTFKVKHFWKDFNHTVSGLNDDDGNNPIYDRRNYLFKNNLGYYENQYDICDIDGNSPEVKHTSIEVFHYGGVRTPKVFLDKKNDIERAYHDDWKDMLEWNWTTSGEIKEYDGLHPCAMNERIRREI